jgi:hypothetical protein
MNGKRFKFSLITLLLTACTFNSPLPATITPLPSPTRPATRTPVVSNPFLTLTFEVLTPIIPQTSTEGAQTEVATPTICKDVAVTVEDTAKGDVLHISRCTDGWSFISPPVAKGGYGVGPDGKFVLYCTNDGYLYGIRIGDPNFRFLENIKTKMPAFRSGKNILLVITFKAGEIQLTAKISDHISGQSLDVKVPLFLSE